MTLCNNAFVDLSSRMNDILGACFEAPYRGDPDRVKRVAGALMNLLSNAYFSVTWVNAEHYKATHPNEYIANTDTAKISAVAQVSTLKHYYDNHAIAAYERWAV